MNKEIIELLLDKIESFYDLPVGCCRATGHDHGNMRRKINGIRVDMIRMALVYYMRTEIKMTVTQVADLLRFKNHSSSITSLTAAVRYLQLEDPLYLYYHEDVIKMAKMEPLEKCTKRLPTPKVLKNKKETPIIRMIIKPDIPINKKKEHVEFVRPQAKYSNRQYY